MMTEGDSLAVVVVGVKVGVNTYGVGLQCADAIDRSPSGAA